MSAEQCLAPWAQSTASPKLTGAVLIKDEHWKEIRSFVLFLKSDDNRSENAMVLSATDADFFRPIGEIITAWSVWESFVNDMIFALLKREQKVEKGWYGLPYSKREALLVEKWDEFASGSAFLINYMVDVMKSIKASKIIRDHLSHDIISSGVEKRGDIFLKWIRFKRHKNLRQNTKAYYIDDLNKAMNALYSAAGALHLLRRDRDKASYSLRDELLLRTLPETEMNPPPTGARRRRPPRP